MLPMLVSLALIKHLISYSNSTALTIQYPHFTEEGIKAKRNSPTRPDHADNIKGATVFQEICLLSESSTGGWLCQEGAWNRRIEITNVLTLPIRKFVHTQ